MSNLMEITGEKTIIDTILDLLIHLLYRIQPDGVSMRRNKLNLFKNQYYENSQGNTIPC